MKKDIFDNIVKGLVFGLLVLFGLRGFLPDIAGSEQLPVLLSSGIAVILGFAMGQIANKCEPTCDPKVCRPL